MVVSVRVKSDLLDDAKQHWIDAEALRIACLRAHSLNKRFDELLKGGTVVAALFTAAATCAAAFHSSAVTSWHSDSAIKFGACASLLTAVFSILNQNYYPGKEADKYWEWIFDLTTVQKGITDYSANVEARQRFDGKSILDPLIKELYKITKEAKIKIKPQDKKSADDVFSESKPTIYKIIQRVLETGGQIQKYEEQPEISNNDLIGILEADDNFPVEMAFDATGVIAAVKENARPGEDYQ